jgi:hypothetical protein
MKLCEGRHSGSNIAQVDAGWHICSLLLKPARAAKEFSLETLLAAAGLPSLSWWGCMKHIPRVNVDSSVSKVLATAQSPLADRLNHHSQDIQRKGTQQQIKIAK